MSHDQRARQFFSRSSPATSRRSIRCAPSRAGPRSWASRACRFPTWDARLFDLERAAESKTYCDEIKGDAR